MDANALAEPPTYDIPQERPAHQVDEPLDPADYPRREAALDEILLDLVGSPNIASRRWVWQQYDHQVQLNTVIVPGGDAALLRIKKTGAGIAVCTDGNGRQTYLDPYRGGKAAVAEAARNVSCVGAKPIAITNCLNFGNPDNGPIAYQLAHAIEGMAEACEALGTPVISGNVSLYNESFDQPIYPTAVVGMLGLMDDVTANCTIGFKAEGDLVYLLGDAAPGPGRVRVPEAVVRRPEGPAGRPDTRRGSGGRGGAAAVAPGGHRGAAAAVGPRLSPTAAWRWRWRSAAWPEEWARPWHWTTCPVWPADPAARRGPRQPRLTGGGGAAGEAARPGLLRRGAHAGPGLGGRCRRRGVRGPVRTRRGALLVLGHVGGGDLAMTVGSGGAAANAADGATVASRRPARPGRPVGGCIRIGLPRAMGD